MILVICTLFVYVYLERTTDCKLEDVLVFLSGADCIPPLGFPYRPKVSFLHGSMATLCKSNTCGVSLKLPTIHAEYETFKDGITLSVLGHDGLGGGV